MERWRISIFSIALVSFVLWLAVSPVTATQQNLWGNQWTGPWVDRIMFEVIENETEQIHALLNADVDIIGNPIDPIFIPLLQASENIELTETLEMGYGEFVINCRKYPMNFTSFRRSLAYAVDKNRIVEEACHGLAIPLDCPIPRQHPTSIEEDMLYHYYDENIEEGLKILEPYFKDSDDDGWLEGPGPEGPGTVELNTIFIEGPPSPQIEVCIDIVTQALQNLGFRAEGRTISSELCDAYLDYHGDFDIIFHNKDWRNRGLDDYARDLLSENVNVSYYNQPNWINATWDWYANWVFLCTDYDDIICAVLEMENICVHSCPSIVLYQNKYFTACRTDDFEGVSPSIYDGAPSIQTSMRIHKKKGDVIGGTYTWAIPTDITTLNPFMIYHNNHFDILDIFYDSLLQWGSDGNDIFWMCGYYQIYTRVDWSEVPENHTRIIAGVISNATWSDGTPITAEDFAFSLKFIRDYVQVEGADLKDMVECYAVDPYTLFVEFNSELFWHWHAIAYKAVIPYMIWEDYGTNYTNYQPDYMTLADLVTSGPFFPTFWYSNNFIEVEANMDYFRNPRLLRRPTTESEPTESSTNDEQFPSYYLTIIAGLISATVVIICGSFLILKVVPMKD